MKKISVTTETDLETLKSLNIQDCVLYDVPYNEGETSCLAHFAVSSYINTLLNHNLFGNRVSKDPNLFLQSLKLISETHEIWAYPLENGLALLGIYELGLVKKSNIDYDKFFSLDSIADEGFPIFDNYDPCTDPDGRSFSDYIKKVTPDLLDMTQENNKRYYITDDVYHAFKATGLPNLTLEKVLDSVENKLFYAFAIVNKDSDLNEERYLICTREENERLENDEGLYYKVLNHKGQLRKISLWGEMIIEFSTEIAPEHPLSLDKAPPKHVDNSLYGSSKGDVN
jgi:hypothetical protein